MTNPSWERWPEESARAYEAAFAYFEMGAGRSLAAVSNNLGKNVSLMKRWSGRYDWAVRAAAYDELANQRAVEALEAEAQKQAERWRQLDEEQREANCALAMAGIAKAEQMLKYPLATQTRQRTIGPDGRTIETVVVTPTRWNLDIAARLLKTSFELADDAVDDGMGRPRRSQQGRR